MVKLYYDDIMAHNGRSAIATYRPENPKNEMFVFYTSEILILQCTRATSYTSEEEVATAIVSLLSNLEIKK